MAIVLFDTNIIIDNFKGVPEAAAELSHYDDAIISSISWVEVACKMGQAERIAFNALLVGARIRVIHPNDDIMDRAATIRGDSLTSPHKVKLADCIIRATAESQSRIIITRNASDFGGESPTVRVPYELHGGAAINIRTPLA
jgi:predicted nucleic acid-binding protein